MIMSYEKYSITKNSFLEITTKKKWMNLVNEHFREQNFEWHFPRVNSRGIIKLSCNCSICYGRLIDLKMHELLVGFSNFFSLKLTIIKLHAWQIQCFFKKNFVAAFLFFSVFYIIKNWLKFIANIANSIANSIVYKPIANISWKI